MSEPTRALIYRCLVLGVILYVAVARPDSLAELVPVLAALGGNVLASMNTNLRYEDR